MDIVSCGTGACNWSKQWGWGGGYLVTLNFIYMYIYFLQAFQRELGRRQANYDSVMNAGRTMINENKVEDPQKLEERLDDLRTRWEAISALAATKQDR